MILMVLKFRKALIGLDTFEAFDLLFFVFQSCPVCGDMAAKSKGQAGFVGQGRSAIFPEKRGEFSHGLRAGRDMVHMDGESRTRGAIKGQNRCPQVFRNQQCCAENRLCDVVCKIELQ